MPVMLAACSGWGDVVVACVSIITTGVVIVCMIKS